MRNQRAGQATFIPLDSIQVKPINDKFRSFAKGARLAADVVQYEPAVERAIHHACGNALVCDTMEVARYVCYEKGQDVKGMCLSLVSGRWLIAFAVVVTLEGTVIHKSGLITGGRSTHSTKKWDESDVKGMSPHLSCCLMPTRGSGLQRARDSLMSELRELSKKKPRGKADENLIAEMTRLESTITLAKDDLVSFSRLQRGSNLPCCSTERV